MHTDRVWDVFGCHLLLLGRDIPGPAGEAGGEPAAGCGCDRVAEEGWAGVSDADQPDAAGADVEELEGNFHPSQQAGRAPRFLGRVEEGDILSLRLRSGQSGADLVPRFYGAVTEIVFRLAH